MGQQVEFLIIGQGICGSFLSFELERAGLSHIVIDDPAPFSASRVAAGLINPVTGRRLVTTWMIDELLAFALPAYEQLAGTLGRSFLEPVAVADLFPTAQMRLAFLKRLEEDDRYLQLPADESDLQDRFRYELGYGCIRSCYLVDLPGLLSAARRRMKAQDILREERFAPQQLVVEGMGVRYGDLEARRIVFCDGVAGFDNPYFSRLPFAPNKGEALIVEIPGLKRQPMVFKKGISLAPWQEGLYWAGSSYEWSFEHAQPTELFRQRTEAALRDWLRMPFRTVEHLASIRPATLERRPFVGFHPAHPAVGILNGMGTKGCSLAPYFAHQLVQCVLTGSPVRADADVRRFRKVLSR
jgi:glycine/D-amino acid oxidase-like deaminating enzyme